MSLLTAPKTIILVLVLALLVTRPSPLLPLLDKLVRLVTWLEGVEEFNHREGGYLKGNWAPVTKELYNIPLDVDPASIPSSLAGGMYLRTGANPRCWPPNNVHHAFNGEAMLHMVAFHRDGMRYSNSWIPHPEQLKQKNCDEPGFGFGDTTFGYLWFFKLLLRQFRLRLSGLPSTPRERLQPGSTSLHQFGDKLYSLTEIYLPYQIEVSREGNITSKGFDTFHGKLRGPQGISQDGTMSAHPKTDPTTGEVFFFSNNFVQGPSPKVAYGKIQSEGSLEMYTHIPAGPSPPSAFYHDMVLTENYAILVDSSLRRSFNPRESSVFSFNRTYNLRFGVLPRNCTNCTSQIKWIESEAPGHIWHTVSGWEESPDTILLFAPLFSSYHESVPIHLASESPSYLTKFSLDLKGGSATATKLSNLIMERPAVNNNVLEPKIAYLRSEGDDSREMGNQVIKYDLINLKELGRIGCQPRECVFGETLFVPKEEASLAQEDEGFLMDIVFFPATNTSHFMVWDATTLEIPLIDVKLPQRVPYGVHGHWLENKYFN